jgi:superfamily I DNA/RNA helicase
MILCLTFTNKVAFEMKLCSRNCLARDIQSGTFDAFGAWFLRHEAHRTIT